MLKCNNTKDTGATANKLNKVHVNG